METTIGHYDEWMRRQGYRVVQTASTHWVEYGPHVFQAIPFNQLITPSENELTEFLHREKAAALRYSTPLESKTGSLSYHVVYELDHYSLEELPKKARYDVRKGLSTASIEQVSLDRLAEEGWSVRAETLQRQGRSDAETEAWWKNLCLSARDFSNFEAWAAIVEGRMVACLLAVIWKDTFSVMYQQSLTDFLPYGVNNAITYSVTANVVNRPGNLHMFYGLQSLDASESVDKYKFRMGYTAKPVRQRVVFHPLMAPFINKLSFAGMKAANKILPRSTFISKTAGIMSFYLQGSRPLEEQAWSDELLKQKEAILGSAAAIL